MTGLTQELIKDQFDYDPDTGALRRKKTGTTGYRNKQGYVVFYALGKVRKAHRLIWLYVYGYIPEKPYEVDHINGDGCDNRLSNLRVCTHAQNLCNIDPLANNKLGVKGVYRYRNGKFAAQITAGQRQRNLGYFKTLAEAESVRREATAKYHGEYGR